MADAQEGPMQRAAGLIELVAVVVVVVVIVVIVVVSLLPSTLSSSTSSCRVEVVERGGIMGG